MFGNNDSLNQQIIYDFYTQKLRAVGVNILFLFRQRE